MAPWTSPVTKSKICTLKYLGFTHNEIRAALPNHNKISDRQINRIFNRYAEKENYYDVGKSTGRPRKLDDRDLRVALRHLNSGDAHDATDLQREHFPLVSVYTLRRRLQEKGLKACRRATVPFISIKHLKQRKDWAIQYLGWMEENWCSVTFSDESIFHVFGSDGMEWCWRKPGDRLDPRYTKKRVKHGGGKVTVWGMITPMGVGRIVRIEGNLNAKLYCEILQDDVLGTYHDLNLNPRDFYFQQDNDPKHTAKISKAWFQDHNIDLLPWPASSPDINIIENLWDHLDRRVRARVDAPTSEEDLWIILQEEWYKIEPSFIRTLYSSLPDRLQAVVYAKGGNTRY